MRGWLRVVKNREGYGWGKGGGLRVGNEGMVKGREKGEGYGLENGQD
jgi:hypothetical protein